MENIEGLRQQYDVQQGTTEWLELRHSCTITASEVGQALGLGFESRAKLINRKLGLEPEVEDNEYMAFGREHEAMVAAAYEQVMGEGTYSFGIGTFCIPETEIVVGASPDRIVNNERRIVEIKCSPYTIREEPQPAHLAQLLTQMVVFGIDVGDLVYWCPMQNTSDGRVVLRIARVRFKPILWHAYVVPMLKDFRQCLQRRIQPIVKSHVKKQILQAFHQYTEFLPIEVDQKRTDVVS